MKLIDAHTEAAKNYAERIRIDSRSDELYSVDAVVYFTNKNLESSILRTIKRTIDVTLAGILVLLSMPLLLVIALAIKCGSRGPILYTQMRQGIDGKPFRMWKFRTMIEGAERELATYLAENPAIREEWLTHYKLKNDPRVIPWIGRLLRKTSLDELPQLWNVLVGDMSLVGPRPLPAYHIDQFEQGFRGLRCSMPPGITGPWQISSRDYGDRDTFQKWDSYYIQNWSIWLDIQILYRTPWVVLTGKGAG